MVKRSDVYQQTAEDFKELAALAFARLGDSDTATSMKYEALYIAYSLAAVGLEKGAQDEAAKMKEAMQ